MLTQRDILEQDICALAYPKGKQPVCSICSKKARYMCNECKRVFYCSTKHRDIDLRIIHRDLCHVFKSLKPPDSLGNDRGSRAMWEVHVEAREKEIVRICLESAHKALIMRKSKEAVHQLRVATNYAKNRGIELRCTVALLLVEALNESSLCEDAKRELSNVAWFLEDPIFNEKYDMKADFYMNEGFYEIAVHDLESANLSFANEIYCATKAFHEEHSRTATGYFHLGLSYLLQKNTFIAGTLFLHAVTIWTTRLDSVFDQITNKDIHDMVIHKATIRETLSLVDERRCGTCLENIHTEMRNRTWTPNVTGVIKVLNAMALFYFITARFEEAEGFVAGVRTDPVEEVSLHEVLSRTQKISQRIAYALLLKHQQGLSKKVSFQKRTSDFSIEALSWYRLRRLSYQPLSSILVRKGAKSSHSATSSIELNESINGSSHNMRNFTNGGSSSSHEVSSVKSTYHS